MLKKTIGKTLATLALALMPACVTQNGIDITTEPLNEHIRLYHNFSPALAGNDGVLTVDEVLQFFFTPEAYDVLEEVPVYLVDSASLPPFVTARHGKREDGSTFILFETGGIVGLDPIIHEYVHEAEDKGLISIPEFKQEYKRLFRQGDPLVHVVEFTVNSLRYKCDASCRDSERIAYYGVRLALSPHSLNDPAMLEVYGRIFRDNSSVKFPILH